VERETRYWLTGTLGTATSRIFVHDSIYDKFVGLLKEHVQKASVVGDPFKSDTFQGPQVTKTQFERVMSYIEAGEQEVVLTPQTYFDVSLGKSEGAILTLGGEAHKDVGGGKGFYVKPTIFTGVKPDMKIFREEVFGPFVVVCSFTDEEHAVAQANDTTYGLGSAVFTRDLVRAHRVARNIEAGMVWINSSQDSDYRIPFGGVKQSGIGRELGEAGLDAYTNKKSIHVNMGTRL